jgi:hypothetical protein
LDIVIRIPVRQPHSRGLRTGYDMEVGNDHPIAAYDESATTTMFDGD